MHKDDVRTDDRGISTGAAAATGGAVGGVAGGAAAGAAAGGLTGPVGAAVGAVAGAVVGALAAKGAQKVNRQDEDTYWRENYSSREYARDGSYDDYGPAYAHGVDAYTRHPGRPFDELDDDMRRDWGTARGRSSLDWERAKPASRDAWQRLSDRVEHAVPGDSDRDGK